ncbi:MAG: radical SAM family heme chaperone HemW [Deltaproteobacteria bacterium]|nr:radical SAM family heme chaperone HemW [Deltaproteobacteria bacterium]
MIKTVGERRKSSRKCGIYIHFPFCRSKCLYCDFHSLPVKDVPAREYLSAVKKEILQRAEILSELSATTIYFGGGTPSLWNAGAVSEVISLINSLSGREPEEITLEGNPDSLVPTAIRDFKNAGINRISIGIQSFDDRVLSLLGRIHSSRQASEAIETSLDAGLNTSVDILLCKPFDGAENGLNDVARAASTGCHHISAYILTPEEGTPLKSLLDEGKISLPDDFISSEIFMLARDRLIEAGFEHYEISNFAKPGFRSLHNSLYWKGSYYLGFGAGAHSFLPPRNGSLYPSRESCSLLPSEYMERMESGGEIHSVEFLDPVSLFKDFIITRFRLLDGFHRSELERAIPEGREAGIMDALRSCSERGLVIEHGGKISLSAHGILLSNDVFLSFFDAVDH